MALQTLNIGTAANDGTGDNLRVGGDKINDNFSEIYTAFGNGSSLSSLAVTAMNGATANELVTVGTTTTELDAEANLTFDGTTLAVTGNITVPNDGDIGSVGATDAIQISSAGIVTFKDDVLIKDGGTIGVASSNAAITIASTGIVTFVDDILIKDGGTIGAASATTAITIASSGIVTFVDDIVIKDDGTIGTATDADAITIAAAGGVTFSQKSVHSASLQVKNGATSAGFIEFFEDSDNGTNKVTLIGPASTADVTLTLGSTTGTIATTADIAGEATALAIALG